MPDIETYTFSHRELLALLIRSAGVKEGDWQLQANFGFSAGNIGPDEQSVGPAAIVIINHLGITKAKADAPKALVMSATEAMKT